jgi:uncharacterized protein YjiK
MQPVRTTTRSRFHRGVPLLAALVLTAVLATVTVPLAASATGAPLSGLDLSRYVRVGRFDLPEPTRTPAPAHSLLAQEASAVTYDWDTDTLFVAGDGGTSIVQVTKTGQLLNSMTLAPGSSPQGTEFYDTEGLAYVGGGQFVMTEERDRQVVRFTYVAGDTLRRAAVQTVKLGTTVGNIGLEGVGNDPVSGGLILVKEKTPESIFQTNVDWAAGTATNGSPATDESVNLFDPASIGTSDLSDVFALANVSTLQGGDSNDLLVISQESGRIVKVDRAGHVSSSLTIPTDPGSPLSVADQTHEGVTMDNDGTIYEVAENGGGDSNHPQLWVYKPTDAPNLTPTGVVLTNVVSSLPENTSTLGGIKVADITVLDDGLGTNDLTVTGADAPSFQIVGGSLFVKAGTVLDFETKRDFAVSVNVDDPTVGSGVDATVPYALHLTDVVNETAAPGTVSITEVAPWGSGNTPYAADWWEVTNFGATPIDLTGWKMDDNSYSAGSAVALRGAWNGGATPVGALAPGQSMIFLESGSAPTAADATLLKKFTQAWWGADAPPANVRIGFYGGSGVGLSTGGDAVELFRASGTPVTGVSFAGSPTTSPFPSFDNTAGVGAGTSPAPSISLLSAVGVRGAFRAPDGLEIGSPGVDFLAPTFTNVPFDVTVEATATTTPATYSAPTATDLLDGARPVTCSPAAPGPFAITVTTVTCSAADTAGNAASVAFHVTVRDTKPPVLQVPSEVTVEATGTLTPVTFGPILASDAVDGVLTATCSPASATSFPLGTTHVDCFAVDGHGNRGAAPFNVTVRDTTAPVVTVPSDITMVATSPSGAVVTFSTTATDAVGVTASACAPTSGSHFAIGTTTVDCTAGDAAGNTGQRSFTVHVKSAAEQLADLLTRVTDIGPGKSLASKVSGIQKRVAGNDHAGACGELGAFVNEVSAQTGKSIPTSQAASLKAAASTIAATLGC